MEGKIKINVKVDSSREQMSKKDRETDKNRQNEK